MATVTCAVRSRTQQQEILTSPTRRRNLWTTATSEAVDADDGATGSSSSSSSSG
eukprot:CAMPEP_0198494046 /NCGR_PEP_ID=MMETSP1462-20131121/4410_1 /TAXON_ID=1333877 /ORGANISM="Brandtodinium nutriculum, Strain RCC3387" /LENGTH=53 /DNA_ID=CAMNT_0044222771 /DNA_START=188 /DNA_END=346 /DNA_ORIENTATION=+